MFRGKFKFKNSVGNPFIYSTGDIVVYQGKIYKSIETTEKSPMQSPKKWVYLNSSEPYRGSVPPINPKENQIWISDDGVTYIYFYDGNSYQWIST